ncbi:TPA: response regulator transcription factor [Klebsiella oxytoca]|nr:response regulator transcription factor [Klebsiella oxytoca]HDS6520362.1 response regulator transcription factor [Klebsiella oxytoca]
MLFQQLNNFENKGFVIFDLEDKLYFIQNAECYYCLTLCLFDVLSKGICFNKQDINSVDELMKSLGKWLNIECNYERNANGLSEREYVVIKSLCSGYSCIEISKTLNRSIKTVSVQKNRALRKLGMRNLQSLHCAIMRWDNLIKSRFLNSCKDESHCDDLSNTIENCHSILAASLVEPNNSSNRS